MTKERSQAAKQHTTGEQSSGLISSPMMSARLGVWLRDQGGYPWLFLSRNTARATLVTALVASLLVAVYLCYRRAGAPASPAGWLGVGYAILGTGCFMYALLAYRRYRRRKQGRRAGSLHTRMLWHGSLATIGLCLLCLHSFGYLDPHLSGTYALYGLVVTIGSGGVGRLLDHVLPRLMTIEVDRALPVRPQEAPTRGPHPRRGAQFPQRSAVARVQQRVLCYRGMISCWRTIHTLLAWLTFGLIVWHLVSVGIFFTHGYLTLPSPAESPAG